MKTKFLLTSIFILSVLFFMSFKKGNPAILNQIVPKKEIVDNYTRFLVAHEWMVQETIQNLNCDNVHYIRGKINETGYDQGILRLTFREDGTGTYVGADGTLYKTRWKFTGDDQSDMSIEVKGVLMHDWHMVVVTDDYIMETTKIEGLGLVTAKWVPVKKDCGETVSAE
jgi:hypothetical protein